MPLTRRQNETRRVVKRQHALLAAGRCRVCGKEKPKREHLTLCKICADRNTFTNKRRNTYRREQGLCLKCGSLALGGKYDKCIRCVMTEVLANARESNARYRMLEALGGKCACCGEENFAFLTFDHIYGFGSLHRKIDEEYRHGAAQWLEKYGTEGFRVLCMNCNWVTRNGDICPHNIEALCDDANS